MSILVPGGLPYTDRHGNGIYTDFRNMLRLGKILSDDRINEQTRIVLAVQLLYGDDCPALSVALEELSWFYHQGKESGNDDQNQRSEDAERSYNFDEDSDYIYAGFLTAYGINLTDESLDLHWWEFVALFAALPENTLMRRIMYYRTVDINGLPKEQRAHHKEMKRAFALDKNKPGKSLADLERERKDYVNKRLNDIGRSDPNVV